MIETQQVASGKSVDCGSLINKKCGRSYVRCSELVSLLDYGYGQGEIPHSLFGLEIDV